MTNIVRACYVHDQGCEPGSWMEENVATRYLSWCEDRVNEWRRFLPTGVHPDSWSVTIGGTQLTFHDWLKQRVGLS